MRLVELRGGLIATSMVMSLASCGNPVPMSPHVSATPTNGPLPRPSAAAGPCASVHMTTPIDQVPAACAALWAPYGVTKVPPANLTDSTPAPPPVVNATKGAVSDAEAQSWALAANRTGVWLRWSEAYDQYQLTTRIESSDVVNAQIDQFMRQGVSVADPPCDLFAQSYRLFPLGTAGPPFFAAYGETTHDAFVLVEHYPGPCAIMGTDPTGHVRTLLSTNSPTTSLSAGTIRQDALLGSIWFSDGAGFCSDRAAPASWCQP